MENKNTVYTYTFVNGDKVIVDEAAIGDKRRKLDKWMEVLARLDLDEQANDKKESRRHCSYDVIDQDGVLFEASECPEYSFFFKEMYAEFIQSLTEREFRIYYKRFIEGFKQAETAEYYHVVQSYIAKVEKEIIKKFKKIKKSWTKR